MLSESVSPDAPGRRYYSLLGFFMHSFSPPAGANTFELQQYLRLIGVFDAEGAIKPGVRAGIETSLQRAIKQSAPW